MTANSVIEMLAAPLSPDWTIEGLAEQLLEIVAAEPDKEFVLDAAAATDRQSQRLVRPLLACLANMAAAEGGITADIFGGQLTFRRVGPEGPVWILGEFQNKQGAVRGSLRRSVTPPLNTDTGQKNWTHPFKTYERKRNSQLVPAAGSHVDGDCISLASTAFVANNTEQIDTNPISRAIPRLVFLVTGKFLVAAAILIGIQLVNGQFEANELLLNRSVAILAVFIDVTLGAWLITGVFPRVARTVGVMCYFVLCVVAIYQVMNGRSSCGCFGQVQITPWVAATIDLAAAIALLRVRPPTLANRSRPFVSVTVVVLAALTAAFALWLMSPNSNSAPLELSPPIVDLGIVDRGQHVEAKIGLTNNSHKEIQLKSYITSCPCLSVTFIGNTIGPGESIQAIVHLDLKNDPKFAGKLYMFLEGLDADGKQIYQLRATAEVRNR